jgi:peroxiredoxin
MLKKYLALGTLALSLALTASTANAEAVVGEKAPDFTLTDTKGNKHSLSDFAGKVVVLEWLNHNCPFVAKLYPSDAPGLMPQLQKKYTEQGVIWLSINSTNPDHKDFVTNEQANKLSEERHASPTAVLVDAEGEVGKAYGAKTTPHMFIIDAQGVLVYAGAFDNNPTPKVSGEEVNFVAAALDEILAGKPVTNSQTRQYGCSIKYR